MGGVVRLKPVCPRQNKSSQGIPRVHKGRAGVLSSSCGLWEIAFLEACPNLRNSKVKELYGLLIEEGYECDAIENPLASAKKYNTVVAVGHE